MSVDEPVKPPEFLKKDSWELHRLIGDIACRSAEVDQVVTVLCVVLASTPGTNDALANVRKKSLKEQRELLPKLATGLAADRPDLASRITALVARIPPIMELRHLVIHGVWWSTVQDVDVVSMLKWARTEMRPFAADQLVEISMELRSIFFEGLAIMGDLTGTGPQSSDARPNT